MKTASTLEIDYAPYYRNSDLGSRINNLERRANLVNREEEYSRLVNPSGSKNSPYYRWVRYRESYSGDLVKALIQKSELDPDKHFVYDPMCGSGATLVAAMQLGFAAVGADIIPYSADLSSAKVQNYRSSDLDQIKLFLDKKPPRNGKLVAGMSSASKYFPENNFQRLTDIRSALEKVPNSRVRSFLFIAWLCILEECSNRKKDGNGLATRPSKVTDVWKLYCQQVNTMLEDLLENPLPAQLAEAHVDSAINSEHILRDFRSATNKEVGAVIFSPPYANSFDYFESYKLELLCGYYQTDGLVQQRSKAIRNYRKGYRSPLISKDPLVQMLCAEIREKIPEKEQRTGTLDNRSRLVPNLITGYFEDMEKVLQSLSAGMQRGSHCHIVVDQSAYLGVIIPTDLLLADAASRQGFEVLEVVHCRKAATSGQQLKLYPYLGTMLRESIVTITKL